MANLPIKLAAIDTVAVQRENQILERSIETKDFIFFVDENESDENANVVMYNKQTLELISNNYFASQGFCDAVYDNKLTWINPKHQYNIDEMLKEYNS